jgi:hypothetical protein
VTIRATAGRGWPGRGKAADAKPPRRPRAEDRFGDFGFVVLVATAERYALPERWGVGVALAGTGTAISTVQVIVADDLGERDPEALRRIQAWAAGTTLAGPLGIVPVEVVTRTGFFHPTEGLFSGTYWRGRWCVTGDAGRTLGLCADRDHWAPGRGRYSSGWSGKLPGWATFETWTDDRGRERAEWRPLLHQPVLRVAPLADHGLMAEYGRAGYGGYTTRPPRKGPRKDFHHAGHWERGKPFRGRFLDVVGPAAALDGEDTGMLSEHLAAFGLPPLDVPAAVEVGPDAAAHLLDVAQAVHGLALRLDEEAGRWLATREDRRDGIARLSLPRLASPGTLATRILDRSGLTPPLAKFAIPNDRALRAWSAHQHGGWATSDIRGAIVPALDCDARSSHPAAWSLLGCFDILRASGLREVDARADVVDVLRACAAGDFRPLLDPETYRRLGLTRVLVRFRGESWPVMVDPGEGKAPHLRVGPASSESSRWVPWPWAVSAALLSGRVPDVRRALRLEPVGEPEAGRPIPLFDDLVVPAGVDPVPYLVRMRTEAKSRIRAGNPGADDARLAVLLRVVVNALAFGNFARIDDYSGSLQPARWSWPPIAATVPAVSAMWLAMGERWVRDQGGAVINRDTDGVAILASPDGGELDLPDGGHARVLRYGDVEAWLSTFDKLDPFGDGGRFFGIDKGKPDAPLHMLVLGTKRYIEVFPDGSGGFRRDDFTEHAIGGNAVPPPSAPGKNVDGRWDWAAPGADRAIRQAQGEDDHGMWSPDWQGDDDDLWPALRRRTAVSRDALIPHRRRVGRGRETVPAAVPAALGLHPFGPYVQAKVDGLQVQPHADQRPPVALDPGTDCKEWPALCWHDPTTGRQVNVTTGAGDGQVVVLASLATNLRSWSNVRLDDDDPSEVVEIVPELERRLGPWAGLIAAQLAGDDVDPDEYLTVIDEGDVVRWVVSEARRLRAAAFAQRYRVALRTAKGIASGERRPSVATIRKVLAGLGASDSAEAHCRYCGAALVGRRVDAKWCGETCRRAAARAAAKVPVAVEGPCAFPGCGEPARVRSATCSERHRKALGRLGSAPAVPDPEPGKEHPWRDPPMVARPADRMWVERDPVWVERDPEGDGIDWAGFEEVAR